MKHLLWIVFTILFTSNVNANPEWVNKPIQCGSIDEVDAIVYNLGEEFLLRGVGTSYNQSLQPKLVIIGVYANLDTGSFTIVEVFAGGKEACIISFGDNLKFDLEEPILSLPKQDTLL